MGFDKSKVMRAAEKHLAQGKIPSAIKEYQQIVQFEPDDFSALNMLGDLLARTNQQEEAIKCFTRVAEHYREEGFALKAIAMFKKIDRLKPGSVEIAAKLAPLYEVQGLIVDARTQYLLVADAYTRGGQAGKALEVYKKIADLDPNNTDIRLKLAEGYQRENFRNDATEAFSHAGAQFYARAAYEHALDAYTRALQIIPYDHTALSGLTSTHIALGMADEAAEVLESAVSLQPDDKDLLSLLAHAYVEAEDAAAAERATARLVQREPSSYMRFVEVVRLYLKADDQDSALRLLTSNIEQVLSGNQEATLAELLNEILARNPEQLDALRLLVRLHTWQHDDEKLRGALDRLAEAAETAGLEDEERQALAQLVRLAPDETRYRERLLQLGGASEGLESEEAYSAGIIGEEEVPTFESFISMNEEAATETPGGETAQFEWNAATPQPSAADPSASFADLNDDWASEGSAAGETVVPAPTNFQEFDFSETASEQPAAETAAPPVEPAVTAERRDAMLRQELESVDFYLAQGYADIALDTLNMLERQFGTHPDINARRQKLAQAAQASTDAAPLVAAPVAGAVEATDLSDSGATQEAPTEAQASAPAPEAAATPAAVPPKPNLDPGLAAIFDEFRTAVEEDDEMLSDGDYETHYNLGLAYKEMDLVEEAVEEFQTAASLVAPQDGTPRYLQCCNLLGHCFMQKGMPRLSVMWFKRGLEAPGHTEDEYQALRYELGTAYEKMGDLDNALDVFSEVYGVNVSYRGVADKLRGLQAAKTSK